jgi:uncharacterized DUF497 family protein
MAFEWDEEKAAENLAKHGIPFEYATRVFDDPYHIEAEDPGFYDEIRYYAIGMVENFLLFVAFTYRQDHIRLISARKATPRERRHYHEIST